MPTGSKSIESFISKANEISASEYNIPLESLLQELDSDKGRLRYGRLLGVMLKEPFAERFARSHPSVATGAAFDWRWSEQTITDPNTRASWQYKILEKLTEDVYKIANPEPKDVYTFVRNEGSTEGRILRYLLKASHGHLCGDEKARQEIKAAVEKARKEGAIVADPSRTGLVAGIGTVTAAVVAACGPYGVALGPIAGGLALLISQIGLDAFCMWCSDKLEELRQVEKQEEMGLLMRAALKELKQSQAGPQSLRGEGSGAETQEK